MASSLPPPPPTYDWHNSAQAIVEEYQSYLWPIRLYKVTPGAEPRLAARWVEQLLNPPTFYRPTFKGHETEGFVPGDDDGNVVVLFNADNPFSFDAPATTTFGFTHPTTDEVIHWKTAAADMRTEIWNAVRAGDIYEVQNWHPGQRAAEKRFHRAYWLAAKNKPLSTLLARARPGLGWYYSERTKSEMQESIRELEEARLAEEREKQEREEQRKAEEERARKVEEAEKKVRGGGDFTLDDEASLLARDEAEIKAFEEAQPEGPGGKTKAGRGRGRGRGVKVEPEEKIDGDAWGLEIECTGIDNTVDESDAAWKKILEEIGGDTDDEQLTVEAKQITAPKKRKRAGDKADADKQKKPRGAAKKNDKGGPTAGSE